MHMKGIEPRPWDNYTLTRSSQKVTLARLPDLFLLCYNYNHKVTLRAQLEPWEGTLYKDIWDLKLSHKCLNIQGERGERERERERERLTQTHQSGRAIGQKPYGNEVKCSVF